MKLQADLSDFSQILILSGENNLLVDYHLFEQFIATQ